MSQYVTPRPARRLRRWGPLLVVAAMATALVALVPAPAHAAAKWNSGTARYSTITNCPSIIWGTPYQEYGIGGFVSYWGDQQSNPVTPATGETTYMSTYVLLVGSHCSTPFIFPKFVLPAGVSFDKTQAIRCYYTPPGGTSQQQITHPAECPQWSNVAADGRYSSTQTNWHTGWPLPSGENFTNGSGWEFVVPVRATSQQWGSQLRTQLDLADGNSNAPLDLTVPFYTGPAPVTAPGAPTNVSASATSSSTAQVSFNPPADNGGSPITGYTARCASTNGGTTKTASGTSSPVNVTGLSEGKTYACDVRATNQAGDGAWSSTSATFNTPVPATAPGAPTNVSATVLSAKSVRVAFSPPASNGGSAITSYRAQCFSPDGAPIRVKDGSSSPLTITTLSPATTYKCRVRASNAVGNGVWSPYTANFDTPAAVPSRPAAPTVVPLTPTTARVSFAAPADNGSPITSYKVQCVSSNGGTTRARIGTSSPITVGLLSPGKAYRCRVQATNAVGNSLWSLLSASRTQPV